MRWFGTTVLALLPLLTACGSAPTAPPRTATIADPTVTQPLSPPATGERDGNVSNAPEPLPTQAMNRADGLYRDQLATQGRDERFSTDRQIAALEQAIRLYQQFLERAGDDPHYAEAARRSRERIEDARTTLIFLRQAP